MSKGSGASTHTQLSDGTCSPRTCAYYVLACGLCCLLSSNENHTLIFFIPLLPPSIHPSLPPSLPRSFPPLNPPYPRKLTHPPQVHTGPDLCPAPTRGGRPHGTPRHRENRDRSRPGQSARQVRGRVQLQVRGERNPGGRGETATYRNRLMRLREGCVDSRGRKIFD